MAAVPRALGAHGDGRRGGLGDSIPDAAAGVGEPWGEHQDLPDAACCKNSFGSQLAFFCLAHAVQPCTPMSTNFGSPSASTSPQTVASYSSKYVDGVDIFNPVNIIRIDQNRARQHKKVG